MAAAAAHTRWGPFVPSLSPTELLCRLMVLRAFVQVFVRGDEPIHQTLWDAEQRAITGDRGLIEAALVEFDRLPALAIRHVLGAYAKHWRGPKPIRPVKPERTADAGL